MKKTFTLLPAAALALLGSGYVGGTLWMPAVAVASDEDPGSVEAQPVRTADDPVSKEASSHPTVDPYALAEDRSLVRVGQITVPVEKPRSIAYVVADIAIRASNADTANRIMRVEEAVRARDVLLIGMHEIAEGPLMRGVTIDADALSEALTERLRKTYPEVAEVFFVSLFKQDVPRI